MNKLTKLIGSIALGGSLLAAGVAPAVIFQLIKKKQTSIPA